MKRVPLSKKGLHKKGLFSVTGVAGLAVGLLAIAAPATAAIAAPAASAASAASASPYIYPGLPLPAHFSAPYVDVTSVTSIADVSAASGSKYLSLAFLQTEATGSCSVYWAGNTATPVATSTFGADIDRIRRTGGDVIPSFGGYSADTTNTEIADSCTDVHKIALAYEKVITTYKVQRLDFDIEADALSNLAGIDRRNQAIAEVENWAAHRGQRIAFSYTLPSTPQGLGATGLAVLASAAANHAYVAGVNIMTFDYWDGVTHDMLADAKTAVAGLIVQMKQTISPRSTSTELARRVGVIQMNGIDDFGPQETFTPDQAAPLVQWAKTQHLNMLSFWALERDNGGCPGVKGGYACSGVEQTPWAFSVAFAKFNSWWF